MDLARHGLWRYDIAILENDNSILTFLETIFNEIYLKITANKIYFWYIGKFFNPGDGCVFWMTECLVFVF